MVKKVLLTIILVFLSFFCFACGVSLKHIPSQNLDNITVKRSVKVMVADIGDARIDESPDRIGQGASYWLPLSFYARDEKGEILPVSYYLANSLKEDLGSIGYKASLANDAKSRLPMNIEKAKRYARKKGANYLITTKVLEGKTNFWGFIIIPFAEPVWTRIELECELINMRNNKTVPIKTVKKEIEWYFGKITILDAIYDAGLFGKTWHQTAWGKTVISDALAEAARKLSENIK